MSDEDVKAKLKKLSPREREVFFMICEATPYMTIAKTLFIGVTTVKSHMQRIYIKLGLNYIEDRSMRIKVIFEIYCKALHEANLPVKVEEPVEPVPESNSESEEEPEPEVEPESEPESVPQNVQSMVSEDEKAITAYRRGEIITIYPIKREDPVNRRTINPLTLIVVLIVLALAVFGAFTIIQSLTKRTSPAEIIQPTQQQNNLVSSTQIAVVPTNTAVIPTVTPSPQTAALPKSAVLFEDNFDAGLSPSWEIISGNPMVVNGMLSSSEDSSIMVGDPSWKNYSIEYDNRAALTSMIYQGFNVTDLRAVDPNNMYATKWTNMEIKWFIVVNGKWNEIPNSRTGIDWSEVINHRITVNKNTITLYINGIQQFSFVDTKFTQGRVGLLIHPDTQIDNFKVKEILD